MSGSSSGAVLVFARASILHRPHSEIWISPGRGRAPAVARCLSVPDRCPGIGPPRKCCDRPSSSAPLLAGHGAGGGEFAIDGPDEGGELAGDCRHGNGLELAFPDQRSVARAEAALCLPGDLTNGPGGGGHLLLLLLPDPRGMRIAPLTPPRNHARPPLPGLRGRAPASS